MVCYTQVTGGDILQTVASHHARGRVHDRLRGETIICAILEPKNIAGQVESANLTPSVGENLITSDRSADHLVDAIGRLALAVDLLVLAKAGLRCAEFGVNGDDGNVLGEIGSDSIAAIVFWGAEHGRAPYAWRAGVWRSTATCDRGSEMV